MENEHIHTDLTYFANGKLVCSDCVGKRDTHKNECFCECHKQEKLQCSKCINFHRS